MRGTRIETLDDAVAAFQRTNLRAWELVAYAEHLAAAKFTYSRLNPRDTPVHVFACGGRYCQQQALALLRIYVQLGITARPVY